MKYSEVPIRFACFDKKNDALIYQYDEAPSYAGCNHCTNYRCTIPIGLCYKKCHYFEHHVDDREIVFQFCMPLVKSHRDAQIKAKIIADTYFSVEQYRDHQASQYADTLRVALHNTQHIASNINIILLSLFDEEGLSKSEDKVEFVRARLSQNEEQAAKRLLNVIKLVHQIMVEHTLVDTMIPGYSLSENDFSVHKVHKLFLMSFYHQGQTMREKNIKCDIKQSHLRCLADFSTARTAIFQLLQNCIKYVMPGDKIYIEFSKATYKNKAFVEIIFKMHGLQFKEDEVTKILLPGIRGEYARVFFPDEGKGMGLGIIDRMMKLNNGYFQLKCNDTVTITHDNIPYSPCEFRLGFLYSE